MAATAPETLADEQRRRPEAAAAAIGAGLFTILGGIFAAVAYRDLPDVEVLAALRERLVPGAAQEPGLKARQVLFYDDNAVQLVGVALVLALGVAAIGLALSHLYRSVKARRPELPRAAVVAAIAGAVAVAVAGLVQAVGVSIEAASFAGSDEQTPRAARDVLQSPVVVASLILRQIGVFGLGIGFVLIALNAMRAGLLTRFMGVLGIIVGFLFVIPLGSSLPIVQAFWLVALGVLFLGRWPGGMPPAWVTGAAQPWPSQQELRERRLAAKGDGDGDAGGEPGPDPGAAPERPAHASSKKRKRKRRS
ncbi:MAG: hypothetical protein H0T43_01700 [Solirubrobacterales bacterium]|nr:hypothetical protein [Solirubrobacterales bacterium]